MVYRNYKIEKDTFKGVYYEAYNLGDCDEPSIICKDLEILKKEIDNAIEERNYANS